jgi:Spondin_N
VSIAAMIAPSPDWCAVAPDVSLFQDGHFVRKKTVSLYAWDVGADSATTYRAFDADQQPRAPMHPSDSAYFQKDGRSTPVGKVTFVRK